MILIVGGGFLGSYLAKYIKESSNEKVSVTIRDTIRSEYISGVDFFKCDLNNKNDLKQLSLKYKNEDLEVFYLAACHNVDYVYENPEKARKINIFALENFLKVLPNIRRLIFASTDCVYGEDNGDILLEISPLHPVNEYGKQKIKAEQSVMKYGFTCARLPFMIGPSLIEKKHFYDNFVNRLKSGKEYEMIDGMFRSVLSYKDVSELLYKLIKTESYLPSIINIAGDKSYSKYDIGRIIAQKNNLDLSLIKKISEEESKKFFKDRRASSSVMDNTLLKTILNIKEIRWEEDIC